MPITIQQNVINVKNANENTYHAASGYIVGSINDIETARYNAIEGQNDSIKVAKEQAIAALQQILGDEAGPSEIKDMFAGTFDINTNYVAGQYVIQPGNETTPVNHLYKFITDHIAGAWIGTDAVEVKLANEVDNLKSAIDIQDKRTNQLLGLINYDYDTLADLPVDITSAAKRLAVKRNGTYVLLDGTTSSGAYCIIKLNNDVQRAGNNDQIEIFTNGTIFTKQHDYRVNMDVISGTAPGNSDLCITVYKEGSRGNIANRVTGTEHYDCRKFTADGSSYMICIWVNKSITLTNLLLSVTMQDLADKSVYDTISDAINNLTVSEGTTWN